MTINNKQYSVIQIRRGSSAEFSSSDPVLASGEPGFAVDTNVLKIGNGVTAWSSLNAVGGGATISNAGDNRMLTSDGTSAGINGESNLTFDGSLLSVSGNLIANSGEFDIIQFNTNNGSVTSEGQMGWNSTEGTVDIALTDSTVMEIGQHRFFRVRNTTGSPLYKGQVVYASGVHANGIITPSLYVANNTIDEIRFIGLVFDDISHNKNGYVVDFGHLRDLDLDGSARGYAVGDETWIAGDILYAHPTVAGKLTKVKPKHAISLAIILDAGNGNGNGQLFVRPTNFGDLSYNHDVNITGVTNGQFLQYNSGTDYWVASSSGNFSTLLLNGTGVSVSGHTHTSSDITNFNTSVSGLLPTIANSGDNRILTSAGTSTGINAESNLTFDGTKLDISQNDGILRIGDSSSNAGTGPRLELNSIYSSNSGLAYLGFSFYNNKTYLQHGRANVGGIELRSANGSARLYVQDVNGFVGINTSTPSYTMHVVGSGYYNGYLDVDNLRLDANTISSTNSNGNIVLAPNGTGDVQVDADTLRVGDSNAAATITTNGTGNLTINTNSGTNSGSIVINQGSNGNIAITPNGTGEVDLSKVDIDGGSIDNTAIGATTASTGKFTQLYPTVVSNGNVSGSVATDVSTGQIFDMTVTGSTTLSNPTNSVDGVTVRWRIRQDGTGGHSVALGSDFQIPSSASSPLPWSTAANAMDILAATYHAGRAKWDVVAFVPGY